jgi:ribonuclease
MKASDSDRSAAPAPAATAETATAHATGALAPAPTSAGLLMALQGSAGNAAVSRLIERGMPGRALQRGVYAEAGAKAVAVPPYAKAHATWVKARDKPGGWLDMNVVPTVLPSGAPGYMYEKYKGKWYVGHMIFGNLAQPDGNRLPVSDFYREYDVHEWPQPQRPNRGTERIVVGRSRRTWYTNNHYHDFTEFR